MGKNKRGICMADGGTVRQETADELMARMTKQYGAPSAGSAPQQPAPVAQQPVVQKPQQPASTGLGILGIIKSRKDVIDKASGYADGGIAGHVKFKGEGGPREDKIPVKVAGQNINVSDGEQALIIPAKTAANAEAMAAIKQIIASTNDGRQPDMEQGESNFADGGLLDEEARKLNYQAITGISGISAPAPTPAGSQPSATGGISIGKSPAPTIYGNGGLQAGVVQRGIETMRGQLATPASPNAPTDPDTDGRRQYSPGYGDAFTNRGSSFAPKGPSNGPSSVALDQAQAKPTYTVTKDAAGIAGIRAANQSIMDASPSPARTQAAANANEADITGRQGAYMVENNLRSFEDKGNGIARQIGIDGRPKFTNVGTENVTDPAKTVQVNSYNGAADNESMAKANAIRQSIIDKQPMGGLGILGDGGVQAANDEKTARWRQDELLSKARFNPAAGQVANTLAHNQGMIEAETIRGGNQQAVEQGRNATTMRGQDIGLGIEKGRQAIDSPLKQAQTQGIVTQNASAKAIADLQQKAAAGDQQAIAALNAMKGRAQSASDRYLTVQGGEEIGPDGMTKIKRPGGVFDAQTQKFVPMDGGKPAQVQAPASALEYLKKNPNQAAAFKAKYGYLPEGF